MRNLLTLLAILVTGMAIAQRPDISRTISGTIFNVTQAGTENNLEVSTMGTYRVLDGDLLDPLYYVAGLEINFNGIFRDYTRSVSVVSFTTFDRNPALRQDRIDMLDMQQLSPTGSIIITNRGLINWPGERKFILTMNSSHHGNISFTANIQSDGSVSLYEHAYNVPIGRSGSLANVYYNCDIVPIATNSATYDVLEPGVYSVIIDPNPLYNFYWEWGTDTLAEGRFLDLLPNAPTCD